MKKIVIINGNPYKESFSSALVEAYSIAACKENTTVRVIALGELSFNPNLQFGYSQRMELEPDLVQALEDLHWGDHHVWVYPTWWLGMPALMKGFFDRAFLPGITFKKGIDGVSIGLFTGKTARVITTSGDLSFEEYKAIYQASGDIQLQEGILKYCGISSIASTFIGNFHLLSEQQRVEWLRAMPGLVLEDIAGINV